MVRIDMSEFMEKHAVSRLIGAPPGYVGYDEGGVLTEAVRRRPYQVILFDEVEKAHEDVFNVLLQVLDDGRLTDGQGRTVDFKNTIIVLTSNLGSEILAAQPDGADLSMAYKGVMDIVRGHFRPEFLNRLDETVLFRRLQRSDMASIVDIQLVRLRQLLADRKITLELDRVATDWLANEGYDPVYGARPLKRVIQRSLQNPLAGAILEGRVKDGETVRVTVGARRAGNRRRAGGGGLGPKQSKEGQGLCPWTPPGSETLDLNHKRRRGSGASGPSGSRAESPDLACFASGPRRQPAAASSHLRRAVGSSARNPPIGRVSSRHWGACRRV